MLTTKRNATLHFLYDRHADKVLGFIISQNYSTSEGEELLVEVFVEVWKNIKAFDDAAQKDQLLMILKIAAKFMYKENRLYLSKFLLN